ncbi:MraY family glycosyltransferase [Nonomuraea sp. NPDC023979]|uniref:glycosyltransferase family 4 protein n=1 Tax=Nonomuraea sp. NPDC023979 TaxID=3154796 RepID=UPI0033F8E2A5
MREYLYLVLTAAVATYILVPLVRRFAVSIGAMPEVRERDVHATPTPRLGGLAMCAGLVTTLLIAARLDKSGAKLADSDFLYGLVISCVVIVALGFLDDWLGLGSLAKLCGQIAAGGVLSFFGIRLPWIPLPNGATYILDSTLSTIVTIGIVVAIINSLNFVDGLDGLAAGITTIAAAGVWLYSIMLSQHLSGDRIQVTAIMSAILIGVCLGFLPHNFHPARIFMGDTGSMLLGLVLATSMVLVTSDIAPDAVAEVNRFPMVIPLVLPVALIAVPLIDLLSAVIRRTSHGKSPFAPDRGHLHHVILDSGHSHTRTVLILYAWAGIFTFGVVALALGGVPLVVLLVAVVFALLVLALTLHPRLRAASDSAAAREHRGATRP